MADSGYKIGAGLPGIGGVGDDEGSDSQDYWDLERLKQCYLDYLDNKRPEIDEQIQARRYRHATQWTSEQVKVFNKRKQPIVTFNRVGRKIDSVIGLVEKLRQSPKGYPRTKKEQERGGAELATAIIREVLDAQEWKAKSPMCAENGAVDGIGGVELELIPGDQGDPDVGFNIVDPTGFFYDPRSYKLDFGDARYLGEAKWLDVDSAIEVAPDKEKEIRQSVEQGSDLTTNSDREAKWFFSDGKNIQRVRLVLIDYRHKGQWCWCLYTGATKIKEGKSPFHDEKKKSISRYLMFGANVDQDGDRYGFVRNMKSAQDEINMRRSKGLHILNSRGIIAEGGAFANIEEARVEASRPDMVLQPNPGKKVEFDDSGKLANLEGQLKFLEDAKNEIDSFGPNPQLTGQGITKDQSGRAIALLQQAGIAELGPFIIAYRGWKIRIYRAIWNACKEHWTQQRAVRVTDDEKAVDFIQVNTVSVDPMTGMPAMVNTLGDLDVDIILDEGPDSINLIQDTHDALMALAQSGANVPPDIMLEFMPGLDGDTKKRLIERIQQTQQPGPKDQLELQGAQAKIADMQADTGLKKAQTIKTMVEAHQPPEGGPMPPPQDHPMQVQANVADTMAAMRLKHAQADSAVAQTQNIHAQRAKTLQDMQMRPFEMAQEARVQERNASIAEMKAKQKPAPRAA